jgi:signal transduction histidine kinase/ActR/RegA family two-component response regulator
MFERSYLQNIIVNAPIGIITTDMDLRVTFMSESAKSTISSGRHSLQEASIAMKVGGHKEHPGPSYDGGNGLEFMTQLTSDPDEIVRHLTPVIRQEQNKAVFEVELIVEGRTRTLQFTTSLLRDDHYMPIGLLFMCEDVTERKALQQQLIYTRKMETVSVLAGGIAHDFNNILTGVLGYSSLIKSILDPGDPVYGFVNSIESSALYAKELNDQLVAFAMLGKYDVKPIDLNNVTGKTLGLLRLTMNKDIRINTILDENVKWIEANEAQIQQVITNICMNASEAMPDGGILTAKTENLTLHQEKPMGKWAIPAGEYVRLLICDTGKGIDENILGKIFEPFFSTRSFGSGLGLAAAYGIVKSHKGFISASSTPGKGTTIDVCFPALKTMKRQKRKTVKAAPQGKCRVLVVDDEQVVREILCEILKELGYDTITAEDGEHAMPIYRREWRTIDIVFLDMIMPGMNGEETFHGLKKINPGVKVIVCTGYTEEEPIRKMIRKGALGVVNKPFRMGDIASAIGEALSVSAGSAKSKGNK